MHIVIDDTYGPESQTQSKYVSGERRTHVAVLFKDKNVQNLREEIRGCLEEIRKLISNPISEFHFVDIYNRKQPWDRLPEGRNLKIIEFFAFIYSRYRWPVIIQTIDSRTLLDHGIEKIVGKIEGLDLSNSSDLSLLWLLFKIKIRYKQSPFPIHMILDEGRKKPGAQFGSMIFHNWPQTFEGTYASSADEPLLQLADFIAYCINRSTHLSMKAKRTEVDNWFLNLVGRMRINSNELVSATMPIDSSVENFDNFHKADRKKKGLEKL
jgi:hypothetical protein